MAERADLLVSIASTIRSYRHGEIPEPTPEHVDRWASQFRTANQLPFLREFAHVIKQTFMTKEKVSTFLGELVKEPKLVKADPVGFWTSANFLQIQQKGQSQKAMLSLFSDCLAQQCGVDIKKCGRAGGDYIYLDDVLFTGGRISSDLEAWIAEKAPTKAVVHVILIALHSSGNYFLQTTRLAKAVKASGKDIDVKFWCETTFENAKNRSYSSDVLWPAAIPDDALVQAYVASETKYPLIPRRPGGPSGIFSSEAGRQMLEDEFLIAGVRIRSLTQHPNAFIRPLGNSHFGVGFGSLIATYRNCPNNCPLAMHWGDPTATSGALRWYPLLPRKTYSSFENVMNGFDDVIV